MRKSRSRPQVGATVPARCVHSVVELRPPDDHAAFSSLVQLIENFARPRNALLRTLDAQPALTRGYPHLKGASNSRRSLSSPP